MKQLGFVLALCIALFLVARSAETQTTRPTSVNVTQIGGQTPVIDPEDEDAFTYGTTKIIPVGCVGESTSDAITDGQVATPNCDLLRRLLVAPIATNSAAGATPVRFISAGGADDEDEHAVCTGPCNVYSIIATNTNAAVRYLKCENDTAANTAPGTDTPEFGIAVPGATTGAGFAMSIPVGKFFSTALTCWLVTGAADSDVADVAANELMLNYDIKQ